MLPIDTGANVSQMQDSYLDPNSLNSIKAMGRDKDPQALKEVAKKFEAMFVQQMLKTMREANAAFGEGNYFDSQATHFHRDMLDQQMVLNLTSGSGIGLADHFYKQMLQNYGAGMKPESAAGASAQHSLQRTDGLLDQAVEYKKFSNPDVEMPNADDLDNWVNDFIRMSDNSQLQTVFTDTEAEEKIQPPIHYGVLPVLPNKTQVAHSRGGQKASISSTQENFVMMLKPHAEKAAAELNINPDVLIAQVALETGWGKHVIHDKQGENSFNLFNIKAGSQWQGDKVNVSTLEYRDGIAANEKADFRKYTNYADSFSDYVQLMKNSSRYEQVLQKGNDSAAYAEALQSAGYATDPEYAQKLKRLLNSDAIKSLEALNPIDDVKSNVQSVLSLATSIHRQLVE
jgi:peptidoglycan hydrolase FlgJ